jgi:hypothetical protein
MTTQYNLLIRWIVEIFSVQSLEDVGWWLNISFSFCC